MNDAAGALERRVLELLERALALPAERREAFVASESAGDEVLRDRALLLLRSIEEAGEQLATGGAFELGGLADDAPAPERIGAYRVIEKLGEGGMGAVYRAERDAGDFAHVVAIKVVRPGRMSAALVERFELERQILASLSHPNIARLYDGGTSEDGGPFIIMEYIEGTPLLAWADEQGLDLDARLALFEQVAEAVAFAHQNLIVHRDLTPSNVLVTGAGVPKLIDFGIARAPGGAEGQAGERVSHTPGYAAPERFAGQAANTLVDVYSLGRILQDLAGKCGNAEVDAIAAKAAAIEPGDRYRSVRDMIEEIAGFRGHFPVAAYSRDRSYRLRKFAYRRRYAMAAVAAVVLALVGGLTATAIGFQRAQTARIEAETRFGEVRALAKTLLFDVYDSVSAVPGSTAARKLLAETAQQYLDTLAQDPGAPAEVRLEAGRGFMRLGDVMGGPGGGTLGLREQALANYERGDAILTALYREDPDSEAAALALADARITRANAMIHLVEDSDKGLAIARTVAPLLDRRCADVEACALARANGLMAEAENLYWLDRMDEAKPMFDRAIAMIEALPPSSRQHERAIRQLARAYRLRGDNAYYLDDAAGAARDLTVATSLLRDAREMGIDNPDLRRELAIYQWSRGGTLDELDRMDEAVDALDEAYAIMSRQVSLDEDDLGSLRLLAVVGGQRALTLSHAGRLAAAIEGGEASLAVRQRLSAMQPEEAGYFRDVAIMQEALGAIYAAAGNKAKSCRYYRDTLRQFDAFDRRWGMSDFDRDDTYARAREALADC